MKPKKLWTPSGVSRHLDDDGDPISESLFGFHTKPGKTPIDNLIAAVETSWMEWDINDPKFIKLATKLLGSMPDYNKFVEMIKASSQSQELKDALINKIPIPIQKTPPVDNKLPINPNYLTPNQTVKWKPHKNVDMSKYLGSGSVTFKRSGRTLKFDECCGPLPAHDNPSLYYWEFINVGPWKYSKPKNSYPKRRINGRIYPIHTKYIMVGNVWPVQWGGGVFGMGNAGRRGAYIIANKAVVRTALNDNITSLIIKGKTII